MVLHDFVFKKTVLPYGVEKGQKKSCSPVVLKNKRKTVTTHNGEWMSVDNC